MGEAHADVLLDRLRNRYGVQVDQVDVRVPLRETLAGQAKGHGRHVKQSGGHGQYAVCDIEVEPLPPGSGFEFVDKVVGGSVPRQFIPSVEKGVRAQLEKGLLAGYPVVDVRVTLFDGKAHSVDSSDMAFQTAGAARPARRPPRLAGVQLLEPIDEVDVLIDDDFVGAVMGDLSTRRARVLGTEPVGRGRTLVKAETPQLELVRYATELRSLSHGTGTFSRRFSRYDAMPQHVAAKVRELTSRGSLVGRGRRRFVAGAVAGTVVAALLSSAGSGGSSELTDPHDLPPQRKGPPTDVSVCDLRPAGPGICRPRQPRV